MSAQDMIEGLKRDLAASNERVQVLEAALDGALQYFEFPYPEEYWNDYPKYKARNDAAAVVLKAAKDALSKEDTDDKAKGVWRC